MFIADSVSDGYTPVSTLQGVQLHDAGIYYDQHQVRAQVLLVLHVAGTHLLVTFILFGFFVVRSYILQLSLFLVCYIAQG